jgi:hypothetical protein
MPSQTNQQQSSRLLSQPSPKPATRLDRLKRQLLDKADWAAISVSRPLQMRFTPTAELEGFGKRRCLTEADRNRLANCGTKPPVPEVAVVHQSRREASPGIDTIGDMDIRINGALARKDEDIRLSSSSSLSMLLDRESPCLEHESHGQNDRCANINLGQLSTSVQPSTSLLSALLPSPSPVTELPPFSPIAQDTGTFIDNPFSGQRLLPELRETSPAPISCSYVTQSMESPIRRFTIDDQVFAKQEGMLDISSTIPETQHISRQSDEGSRPAMLRTQTQSLAEHSSAGNQHSPWLPQPTCNIRRQVDREADSTSGFVATRSRYSQSHFPHVEPESIAEQLTSPVKIFGQSVIH